MRLTVRPRVRSRGECDCLMGRHRPDNRQGSQGEMRGPGRGTAIHPWMDGADVGRGGNFVLDRLTQRSCRQVHNPVGAMLGIAGRARGFGCTSIGPISARSVMLAGPAASEVTHGSGLTRESYFQRNPESYPWRTQSSFDFAHNGRLWRLHASGGK